MALEHLLQRTPSLAEADPETLACLARAASVRQLDRGAVLWRAGDQPRGLVVVKSGLLKVVRTGVAGRRTICGLFGPPASIGDLVLVKGKPYPADAIVISSTAAIVTVPREVVLACIERRPSLAVSIACSMDSKLAALHASIEVLSAGSVESRLATALLHLYSQFGDDFDDGTSSIPLALSRRDLSDLVSTSVETVIRTMSRWEREGVISTEHEGFTIRNRSALVSAAGQTREAGCEPGPITSVARGLEP
jgi:CRP/FNR family transcriptional regulator